LPCHFSFPLAAYLWGLEYKLATIILKDMFVFVIILKKKVVLKPNTISIPYGLTARIAGFHPAGPGSTPGMGILFELAIYFGINDPLENK
jgi:hypothetical protein